MKSTLVPVRLNAEEIEMLDKCRSSKELGELNRSEFLRLLIRREGKRRSTGRSVVGGNEVASDMRNGRPKFGT